MRHYLKKQRVCACPRFEVQAHVVNTGFIIGVRWFRLVAYVVGCAVYTKIPGVCFTWVGKLIELRCQTGARLGSVVTG